MKKLTEVKEDIIKRLIPKAVKEANDAKIDDKDAWNRAYHGAMDRMCRERGVRFWL